MNYELAKKLKEAGFPKTAMGWIKRFGTEDWKPANSCEMSEMTFSGDEEDSNTPCPTLSELIEACGESFTRLEKKLFGNLWKTNEQERWYHTSEEAVANLWLELNKK